MGALVVVGSLLAPAAPAAAVTLDLKSDFGAVGDGVADDTAEIQAALDAGERVDVPAGTYRVTGNLTLTTSSWLRGVGATSVIDVEGDYEFFGDGADNVSLTTMKIKRSVGANTATKSLIRLWRSSGVTFDGLTITGTRTTSPTISVLGRWEDTSDANTCSDIRITNNNIQDYQRIEAGGLGAGSGQGIKGTGVLLGHCKVFDVSGNTVIENQRFIGPTDSYQNFQGAGITVASSKYGVVSQNHVNYAGQGIDIGGGYNVPDRSTDDTNQDTTEGFRGSTFVSVHDNLIEDIYGPAIKLVNGATGNSITDNVIENPGLTGVWITAGNSAAKDLSITRENIISGNTITDPGTGPGGAAWLQDAAGSGIVFEIVNPNGPYVNADPRPRYNTVTRNTITSTTGDMPYGITDAGTQSETGQQYAYNNYIISNSISGWSLARDSIDPARNFAFNQ
ncbi:MULTISPECIES: right-handed parallel beta-helix repeat-containing protein [Microbacterium]|uniref:right-handed parallel beta-helix repeat-containing protein n=1 Tax=Microbacterium TaxID=33882 RepID=UPI00142D61D7|nr:MULTISPECIES: right-handed parallel beta-helix repeat-containing protein [Microbacterium]